MSQPAVLRLPFQNFLKADLHVSRATMATFFALSTLAWYFKPLAGIFTDSVPLFGTRRKYYLILSALIAGALYLLVGVVPRTYTSVLIAMIAVNCMLVVGSTVVGGLIVEIGNRERATGRLNSSRYVRHERLHPDRRTARRISGRARLWTHHDCRRRDCLVRGALCLVMLKEPPVAEKDSHAWINAKAQFRTLMKSKTLWSAAGLLFLVYIAPGFSTPLYYFQVDTLKLSQQFIGWLIMLAGAFGIVGAFIYSVLCKRLNLRTLLYVSIVISTLGTMLFLFYRSGTAAAIIESQNGLIATVAELALMDLAARATPGQRRPGLRPDDERAQRRAGHLGHLRFLADRPAPRQLLQTRLAQRRNHRPDPVRNSLPAQNPDRPQRR